MNYSQMIKYPIFDRHNPRITKYYYSIDFSCKESNLIIANGDNRINFYSTVELDLITPKIIVQDFIDIVNYIFGFDLLKINRREFENRCSQVKKDEILSAIEKPIMNFLSKKLGIKTKKNLSLNLDGEHKLYQQYIISKKTNNNECLITEVIFMQKRYVLMSVIESQEKKDSLDKECIICFNQEANTVTIPCGHKKFCYDCLSNHLIRNNNCPYCNQNIDLIQKIFE